MNREGIGDVVRYMNYPIQQGLTEEELLKWELSDKAHNL